MQNKTLYFKIYKLIANPKFVLFRAVNWHPISALSGIRQSKKYLLQHDS
jgi:hypothetical protein